MNSELAIKYNIDPWILTQANVNSTLKNQFEIIYKIKGITK